MPTLLGRLMARPDADLAALAPVWGARLPGRGHAEDVAALYRVMTDSWALRDVLERLSPNAAKMLWILIRFGVEDGVPVVFSESRPASVQRTTEELIACGLLHPATEGASASQPEVALADETGARLRRLAEERHGGDQSGRSLKELIASLDGGELAAACERWGLAVTPGSQPRAEVEAALLEAVATPLALDDLLAGLDRADRALYELLAAAGRPLALTEARRRLALPTVALRRALRHLHEALLVWESWVERERRLFAPAELRPDRCGPAPATPIAAEPTGWRHPFALAWDLLAWLRLRERAHGAAEPVPANYALWGMTGARTRPGYLRFLRAAAEGIDQTGVAAWAARPLAEQQATLFERWRTSDGPWPVAAAEASPAATAWPAARDALLTALARLEPGVWLPVEAVAPRTRSGRAPNGGDERRLVTTQIQTTLVWLGLLEPGRAVESRRAVVRLTPVGTWLLGRGERPPEPTASLVAEPSLRVLVYATDSDLLWPLLAFAEPEQVDRVSLFRLTRAGVAAGLAANLTAEAMIATLARAARHELPQNVAYSIRDWARGARRARLERALILAFDGDQARDEARAQLALRGLAAELLPRHRLALPVADDAAEERVRAALRQLGLDGDGGMP